MEDNKLMEVFYRLLIKQSLKDAGKDMELENDIFNSLPSDTNPDMIISVIQQSVEKI